jgi:hypothetical protein
MTGPASDRYAIIKIPPGPSPAEAVAVGNWDQVAEYIPQSIARQEAEQRFAIAKEDAEETAKVQAETRACAARMLVDGLEHISNRLNQFETRKAERADQLRRDEEEAEAKAIAEYLDSQPDPDAPDAETVLKDAAHEPTGDLHSIDPVDASKHRAEAVTGAMPRELDKGAPPLPGDFTREVTPASPYRNPTSIGGP